MPKNYTTPTQATKINISKLRHSGIKIERTPLLAGGRNNSLKGLAPVSDYNPVTRTITVARRPGKNPVAELFRQSGYVDAHNDELTRHVVKARDAAASAGDRDKVALTNTALDNFANENATRRLRALRTSQKTQAAYGKAVLPGYAAYAKDAAAVLREKNGGDLTEKDLRFLKPRFTYSAGSSMASRIIELSRKCDVALGLQPANPREQFKSALVAAILRQG